MPTGEHPSIVFRDGTAGRRAGLAAGPDVWEVVAVHRTFRDVDRTASWVNQTPAAVGDALCYYEAHRVEIDDWIRLKVEAAEAAERSWRHPAS